MIKLDLEQGTAEWHLYRKEGINATEAAILMGLEYTPKDTESNNLEALINLFSIKTGLAEEVFTESVEMSHGKQNEDNARIWFENSRYGASKYTPVCARHESYPYIQASLDGLAEDETSLLEIKCPKYKGSFIKHKNAIPAYYYSQIQHQLLVSGAEMCYFISYFIDSSAPKGKYDFAEKVLYAVFPDKEFIDELMSRIHSFKANIDQKIAPVSSYSAWNNPLTFKRIL